MDEFNNYIPDIGYFIYRKCHPGWEIVKSVIDFHDLSYVIGGKGIYYINGHEVPVCAGDVLYFTPGTTREARSSQIEPMELFAVNFWLIDYDGAGNSNSLPLAQKNTIGFDQRLIYLFKQLTRCWIEKNDLYRIEARAVTLQIFCELIRRVHQRKPAASFDARVEIVKDFINENFDTRLSLKQLAKMVSLNDVYLGALFKSTEGTTINEYINKIRINHAADKLLIEKATISETAYTCGFSDAFYFCKVFKKYKGYPPSEIGKHGYLV
ncbi:MAG: AraC family transcriptional regulator [Defluviitaleaceae bacterium]|nr:AraC family transcriptional regulator [Defluviitaleaceae bacterium]MCL2835563.1 AraC family transcriptional regulator [Defluviitaleaceae bacterium]